MQKKSGEVLRSAWPWLSSEYAMLDDNIREMSLTLTDPEASGEERENALINSAELLCRTIRACREKNLFTAMIEDLRENDPGHIKTLQSKISEHLEEVLRREEAVLIIAGLNPSAAQALREQIAEMPRHRWRADPLFYTSLEQQVLLAAEDICHKFPKTNLDFKVNKFKGFVSKIKAKYGIVGGLTMAAANTAVAVLVPEPISVTKLSTLIGATYSVHSASSA